MAALLQQVMLSTPVLGYQSADLITSVHSLAFVPPKQCLPCLRHRQNREAPKGGLCYGYSRRGAVRADAAVAEAAVARPLQQVRPQLQQTLGSALRRLQGQNAPPLSDIVWGSLGAFAGMACLVCLDMHFLSKHGLQMTIGSCAALCTLLFAAPKAPVSQKWNVFVGHMGCACIGLCSLAAFGPGWLSRCITVAASVAFMQFTGSLHPPASGIGLLFIDSVKMQSLQWWYILFPGVAGAAILFAIAGVVDVLRERVKF